MDRRRFSRGVLALPAMAAGLELAAERAMGSEGTVSGKPAGTVTEGARSFTYSGKEERPFVQAVEAELAAEEGSGYLSHMWFGGAFAHYKRLRLRVYVDGETRAAIDMEIGLGAGVGFEDDAAPWGTRHAGVTGTPSGIYLNYRVPFTKSVRVTAELPEGAARDVPFWWIVRGLKNHPLEVCGFRLPERARLRLHKREEYMAQPLEEFELAAAPGAGLLFLVTMAARSGSFQFMEGQMRGYFDGSARAEFLSSGLEDYFLGTYYFNRGTFHLPVSGLTHMDKSDHSFSAYRFHEEDPIVFAKGFRLACRCGEKRGETMFGGSGSPQATMYTTYAWMYEW